MAQRPLVCYPDPRLKTPCEPVEGIDDDLLDLVADLRDTLYAAVGTGLAAPQIGVLRRVIFIDAGRLPKHQANSHGPLTLLNPRIVAASGTQRFREGCLSIPQFTATVKRKKQVTVEALNLRGEPVSLVCEGFEAVLLQHEIDHLDGLLFLDRIDPSRDLKRRVDEF